MPSNFDLAAQERERRINANLQNPGIPISFAATGPSWDAFYGSLNQTAANAHAAGKNFGVNWSGFGADAMAPAGSLGAYGGQAQTPQPAPMQPMGSSSGYTGKGPTWGQYAPVPVRGK
jgi:hypothetical protein